MGGQALQCSAGFPSHSKVAQEAYEKTLDFAVGVFLSGGLGGDLNEIGTRL